MRAIITGAVSLLALVGTACSSGSESSAEQRPISSEEATALTNERIRDALHGVADTSEGVSNDTMGPLPFDMLTGDSSCGQEPGGDLAGGLRDLSTFMKDVASEAEEHVFREEFVESESGKEVVYKLDAQEVCGEDSECISNLEADPVRFAVTSWSDDTLHVRLQVGDDRVEPGTAVIGPDEISVTGNLGKMLEVLQLVSDESDRAELPDRMAGSVKFSIRRLSPDEFALSYSVLDNMEILMNDGTDERVHVTLAASDPASELTLNGVDNSVHYVQRIGELNVALAGGQFCGADSNCGPKEQNGTFGLQLPGLSADLYAVGGTSEFTVSDIGLGDSSTVVSFDDDQLATLDLNADKGRRLSVRFEDTPDGVLVTFAPELDIRLAMMLTHLSESLQVDLPDWLFDEVFDVTLGGDPKPSLLIPRKDCETGVQGDVQVASGTLRLDATSLSSPVSIAAGMCLHPVESAEEQPHPFSTIQSGVCE